MFYELIGDAHSTCTQSVRLESSLEVYQTKFEPQYLKQCIAYYERLFVISQQDSSLSHQIQQAYDVIIPRFTKEFDIVDSLLHYSTKEKIAESFTVNFISKYSEVLVSDLQEDLVENRLDKIKNTQKLFSYTAWAVGCFNSKFSEALTEVLGSRLNEMKNIEMVEMMIDWIRRLSSDYIGESTSATQRFKTVTAATFRTFIATNKMEKMVAKYIDNYIKSIHSMKEEDHSLFYEKVQLIVDLVNEKSLFEVHYKMYLKGRLLSLFNYESIQYESKLIEILKPHMDYEQVEHMELALLDIKHSMSLNTQYEHYLQANEMQISNISLNGSSFMRTNQNTEVDYKIVSFTFWDISVDYKQNLHLFPQEALAAQNQYTKFYKDRFKGRMLIWLYNVGNAVLTLNTKKGKKELTMTKIQCFVCIQMNSRCRISFGELKSLAQIDEQDLVLEILGLVSSEILEVEGKTKKEVLQPQNMLRQSDMLILSQSVEKMPRQVKIKKMKLVKDEGAYNEADADNAFGDYKKVKLESLIMKTLKNEKILRFEGLLTKVSALNSNRFSFTKKELLEVLEKLVNNEYIHRDHRDYNVFSYSDLSTTGGSTDKSRRQLSPSTGLPKD